MSAFRNNILEFNRQLAPGGFQSSRLKALARSRPDGVVIAGMGASGLAGEIARAVRQEIGLFVPVLIWKNYGLPDSPARRPLFVFVSFSGNTEETLSGMRAALKKRAPVAAIATGGTLARLAKSRRVPLVLFSAADLTPRQAVGRMFYGLIEILRAAGLVTKKVSAFTALRPRQMESRGRSLARKLKGKSIAIYTDESRQHLGYIWKVSCNETAKTHAWHNVLPEADHNEIEAFESPRASVAALFLEDPHLPPRLKKKFHLTEAILKKRGAQVLSITLTGKNELEKTWRSVILADWTTYFLAERAGVNPRKTALIDTLKRLMR